MDKLINNIVNKIMQGLNVEIPEYLKKLFEIDKKSELKKYCKNILITQKDFAILVYNSTKIRYIHQIKYNNFVPDHLKTTDEEVDSLFSMKPGEKIVGPAKSFINKITTTFDQRRYLVAHIFYNETKWHCFYFDQRDIQNKHWKEGCHLHFVNYLWPNYDPNDIWKTFDKSNASFGGKLHIKFKPMERTE